jgi:hypothetical protein
MEQTTKQCCQVCGRNRKELQEVQRDSELVQHQKILKCKICRRAYLIELTENKNSETDQDINVALEMGWKK